MMIQTIVSIVDLEIRNGFGNFGSFLELGPGLFNLTNVLIRNMYGATGVGGAIQGTSSTGFMRNVTFINCTHATEAGAISLWGVAYLSIQDITFINCTSLSPNAEVSTFHLVGASSSSISILVAGKIYFEDCGANLGPGSFAIAFEGFSTEWSNIVTGVTADWSFYLNASSAMYIDGKKITFSFKSFKAIAYGSAASQALVVDSNTASSIVFSKDFLVDGLAALSARTGTQIAISVGGDLTSVNCHTLAVLKVTAPTQILARNVIIRDHNSTALAISDNLSLHVSQDFLISRSSALISDSPAIQVLGGYAWFNITRAFNISGSVTSSLQGGAILVGDGQTLNASAGIFNFEKNSASKGGALFARAASTLILRSNYPVVFRDNRALQGGALSAELTSNLIFQVPYISFISNDASLGGALYIYSKHVGTFNNSAFINNNASKGCVVYFISDCLSLFTSATVSGNTQNFSSNQTCPANDLLCDGWDSRPTTQGPPQIPPSNTPQTNTFAPAACLGSPPTPSSTCVEGLWFVPADELETSPTVVIQSPVIIIGPVTVPIITVTNVFGNNQPLLQSNACITVGTINVELTEEDVKSLEQTGPRTTLLTQSNCTSNTGIALSGAKSKRSCKKIESETIRDGGGLSATFRVNSSKCNIWWIALVSVLGGVLLGVVIAILSVMAWRRMQHKLRHHLR